MRTLLIRSRFLLGCTTALLTFAALTLITGPLVTANAAPGPAEDTPIHAPQAHDTKTIEAVWYPQEIRYSYSGFTTAYDCIAAERRIKDMLLALGAHPKTKVRASGCSLNRPSRNFFVTITTATPVATTQPPASPLGESEQKLLRQLGLEPTIGSDAFPAEWRTIELSRDRKLDLKPGDCELMEGLRDHVLPKLSVRVLTDQLRCVPKQLDTTTPALTVSALMALPAPDAPTGSATADH
ncbi:hypothetical protein ACG33_01915 [Steroidobacter denitrificans]|uniref:Secreted protein n=1 Tax=Steroidobacter denitrificans TaxID=465721 RepID=A0A127F616_STEDE|nr:hypothetical protein [Steroidobacter denitrificans]AMN45884.1 hypothetical protein ACG33_01915 [Steroidobacter denitrificans]